MDTITVELGARSYPIHIGEGVLHDTELLRDTISAKQVLVVSNEVVAPLHLSTLVDALPSGADTLILPDGEQHKNLATFERIIDELIELGFHRDACIVALGGGVIGDIVGFAASCYQRGIEFIQAPTSLLAQVDSSVGGKTAVNHRAAKNMIGAFYQPSAVLTDTSTLGTLPRRELSAGLAEVIKHGLILDAEFVAWLEGHIDSMLALDPQALGYAIRRCCEIKAAIVAEDEHEHGRRALLNLGHTFGHSLEALGGYSRWLHGEAVAIGISLAARVSAALDRLANEDCDRIDALLRRAHLPTAAGGIDVDAMLASMQLDKKATSRGLKLVLLDAIGHAVVAPAPPRGLLHDVIEQRIRA